MLLEHPYVTLQYENCAPCILRVTNIQDMSEYPGKKTKIRYRDRDIIVRGTPKNVMKEIEDACARLGFICPLKPEWENNDNQGTGEVSGREPCEDDDILVQ